MKNACLIVLGLLLAACQSPTARQVETYDRIAQELKEASEKRTKNAASEAAIGQAMLPPLQVESNVPVQKAEPRFDLAVNNAAASQVFMALVSGTEYSMLFPPELSGTVTLNLKGVTIREALDCVRRFVTCLETGTPMPAFTVKA